MVEELRDQAALQLHRYRTDELTYRCSSPRSGAGFGLLPRALAGRRLLRHGGRPVLRPAPRARVPVRRALARAGRDRRRTGRSGPTTATASGARSRSSSTSSRERQARFPDMHVYHYAAYEPSTLARLMGTHATREEEIDELLRGEVFVDLLQVVRQGMRAGVESYSLKESRSSFFTRQAEVSSGNEAVIEFERWLDDRDPARLDAIAAYNEEDCLATLELRDWLLARRPEAEREHGVAIPFLPPPEGRPKPRPTRRRPRPHGSATRCSRARAEGDGRELCARLLEYHRREARPGWWWYFRRLRMTDEELVDDGEALGCLEHDGAEPSTSRSRIRVRSRSSGRSRFPPQQHQFDEGDGGEDPREEGTGWTVSAIDNATGDDPAPARQGDARRAAADVARSRRAVSPRRRSRRRSAGSPPRSSPATAATRTSSGCCGASRRSAARSLQRRELAEQRALLDRLEGSYLVVQGPPGLGQDVPRRAPDHAPARAGAEGRDHGAEPQGDPQPARRGRARGRRGGARLQGDQARRPLRERARQDERAIDDVLDPEVDARRRHRLALRARGARRQARHARRRRGRPVQPRRHARLRHLGRAARPARRPAPARPGDAGRPPGRLGRERARARARRARDDPGGAGRLPRGDAADASRRSAASSRRRSTRAGSTRSPSAPSERPRTASASAGSPSPTRETASTPRRRPTRSRPRSSGSSATRSATADGERPLAHADVMVVAPYNAQVRLLRERLPAGVEVGTVDKFQGREAAGRLLLDGVVERRGRPARARLPDVAQPAQRRRLARAVPRLRRLLAAAARGRLPHVEHLKLANALCRFVEHRRRAPLSRREAHLLREARVDRRDRWHARRSSTRLRAAEQTRPDVRRGRRAPPSVPAGAAARAVTVDSELEARTGARTAGSSKEVLTLRAGSRRGGL